jgi:hypothetical protein
MKYGYFYNYALYPFTFPHSLPPFLPFNKYVLTNLKYQKMFVLAFFLTL